MRKHILLCGSLLFLLINVQSVQAHVLKTSEQIGGVLHIAPDDDPKVGEQATFLLEVKDKNNRFNWDSCRCRLKIFLLQNQLLDVDFGQNGYDYVFTDPGVYKIQITGQNPVFDLIYDVRVNQSTYKTETISWWQKIVQWLRELLIKEVK